MSNPFSSTRDVLLLAFCIVASLAVTLRVWARKIQKVGLELNDYVIVLGLIFTLAGVIQYIYSAFLSQRLQGVGHPYDTEQEKIRRLFEKFNFLIPLFWITAVTLIRSSVILLYIRIFITRSFRLTCYAILILNTLFFITTFLSTVLFFIPVGCQWNDTIECSSALDAKSIDLSVAIFNFLLDTIVIVLPMPVLWGLQMAVSKKATLSGIFGLGFTICAITAYRVQTTATIDSLHSENHIIINTLLLLFEAILGVTTACLPVLKPVFSKLQNSTRKLGGRKCISKVLMSASIPIFMLVSQMWKSISGDRAGREGLDSRISTEDLRRSESGGQPTDKMEIVVGIKASEIRGQRDVHVESASTEN